MPERATVFQATQLGVESTKGTAVPANKRLLATMFNLSPQIPVEGFRPMGSKAFTTATRQKEWTEGEIEGVFAFNDIIYLLSGLLEQAAISVLRSWLWQVISKKLQKLRRGLPLRLIRLEQLKKG